MAALLCTLHYPLFTGGEAALAQTAGTIDTIAGTWPAGYGGDNGPAVSANLDGPNGLALDGAGNLYIADTDNNRVRRVTRDGVITTFAGGGSSLNDNGPAVSVNLNSPNGLAFDGTGNLYIADTFNRRIRKVTRTGVISTFTGTGTQGDSGDGDTATAAQLSRPVGVSVDNSGNLYIADQGSDRIRKITPAGVISTFAGAGTIGFSGDGGAATSAQLNAPYSVVLDGAGALYISDTNNNRIRRVDAVTGNISTVAGGGTVLGDNGPALSAQFNYPAGMAFDCAGNLYVSDFGNNRVRKVTALGEPCPPPPPLAGPEPTVEPVEVSELSFAPDADSSMPAPQTLTLRAEGGAVDFQALPSARWIQVSPAGGDVAQWRGRLAEGETITLRVTVNPLGLRPGTHRGRLYIRSGGRITAAIRIVLEVPPPTGPAVTENGGVFNAARMSAYGERGLFGPQLLPLAPGSAVIVQGVNFASGERMEAAGFPLPTMLGGVRVLIDGAAVPLMAVGPQRIEAQLPWALGGEAVAAGGLALASVVVESGGESSWPRHFWAGPYAPGVFTVSGEGQSEGQGQALATFAGTTDLAAPLGFSAGSRPARAGDVLEIYATGLGAVEPPLADGMNSCAPDGVCLANGSNAVLRHTTARPRVWIGAYAVSPENIRFSGLAPDMAGVNLVIVEIPRNLTPSNAAELRLAVAGRISQSGATIAVE